MNQVLPLHSQNVKQNYQNAGSNLPDDTHEGEMIQIDAYKEAFAATGTKGGVIQVAASRAFWPGAKAYVEGTGLPGVAVIVLKLTDTTHIQVGLAPSEGVSADGRTTKNVAGQPADLSAYTVALGAAINVPTQMIFDLPQGGVVPKLPTFW
jgi:hypothetical protein